LMDMFFCESSTLAFKVFTSINLLWRLPILSFPFHIHGHVLLGPPIFSYLHPRSCFSRVNHPFSPFASP
jgi:hypothetical protein